VRDGVWVVDAMSFWRWAEYFHDILLMRFQRWRLVSVLLGFAGLGYGTPVSTESIIGSRDPDGFNRVKANDVQNCLYHLTLRAPTWLCSTSNVGRAP
jgi:hypothetical protein